MFVVLLGGTGHSPAAQQAAGGEQIPPTETDAAGSAGPERISETQVRQAVRAVAAEVERLRGLSFAREVEVSVIDDEQARRHLVRRFNQFQTPEDLEREARAMALLGMLPEDLDVLEAYLGFLREQAGGFYDPGSKSFFLLDDMPRGMTPILVSHELTHALEDQHYDLDGRLRGALPNDDQLFAVGAVHEGSATLLTAAYIAAALARGELTAEDLQRVAAEEASRVRSMAEFPAPLLRPLLGSYLLGGWFLAGGDLAALLQPEFPAARVNRAYAAGPRSSEQVIHPEKYWDAEQRDDPTAVDLGDAGRLLGDGWVRAADGVLGELMIGTLVGAPTPRGSSLVAGSAWTNEAAAGWDGDRWEMWTRGDAAVVLLATVWDTAADAEQFEAALDRDRLHTRRRDRSVAVVAGAAGEARAPLLERLLEVSPATR